MPPFYKAVESQSDLHCLRREDLVCELGAFHIPGTPRAALFLLQKGLPKDSSIQASQDPQQDLAPESPCKTPSPRIWLKSTDHSTEQGPNVAAGCVE